MTAIQTLTVEKLRGLGLTACTGGVPEWQVIDSTHGILRDDGPDVLVRGNGECIPLTEKGKDGTR